MKVFSIRHSSYAIFLLCSLCALSTRAIAGSVLYDFSNRTQGLNIFAYDGESSTQVPSSSTAPSAQLSSSEYDDIEIQDSSFHSYNVGVNNNYAQMRFVVQIDEDENDVSQINVSWTGQGINENNGRDDGASLYIWNYASSNYELLLASADTESVVTLVGVRTSKILINWLYQAELSMYNAAS